MGLLDSLLAGGAGFLTGGWPGAAVGLAGSLGGGDGSKAEGIAMGMSEEQRQLLKQALEMGEQYYPGLLEKLWQQAEAPGEDPWERALWQRTRGDIERAYRPGYASGLADLSRRHMLTEPSSVLGPYTASMERARGGAVSEAALARMAGLRGERQGALGTFANVLAQARGGAGTLAGAYDQPIETFGGLAERTAAGSKDWITGLAELWRLQQQAKKKPVGGPGTYVGDVPGSSYVPGQTRYG